MEKKSNKTKKDCKEEKFIKPNELPKFLENIDKILQENNFSPRKWIRRHLSPERSTKKIIEALNYIEKERFVKINKELAVKVNNPDLDYFDHENWNKIKPYYDKLKYYLKGAPII